MADKTNRLTIEELGAELAASERNAVLMAEVDHLRGRLDTAAHILAGHEAARDNEVRLLRAENRVLNEDHKAFSDTLRALREPATAPALGECSMSLGRSKPSSAKDVGTLRVAGIMDEFTGTAFAQACDLLQISLVDWDLEIQRFEPDILVVESAWKGNQGQWADKIHRVSPDLLLLVQRCKEIGLPTVFWNKEDPVHYGSFISTASLFDYVFTTDLDSVERYKTMLKHNRVYLMPFFCEPLLHSPIQKNSRAHGASFAGAYYSRYPDRQRDFDSIMDGVSQLGDVAIFDRNHGSQDESFRYPERYQRMIRGGLAYSNIDQSYKGYDFGINLNSVKESQTMFARRVFDLILCDTHVVSNYSRGLRLMFGDLVISSDDTNIVRKSIQRLVDGGQGARENPYATYVRYLALRKVLTEHTTSNRLEYMASKIWPDSPKINLGEVTVLSWADTVEEVKGLVNQFNGQVWEAKNLVVVIDEHVDLSQCLKSNRVRYITKDASSLSIGSVSEARYTAVWDPDSKYGPHYLSDAVYLMQLGVSCVSRESNAESDVLGVKNAFREVISSGLTSSVLRTSEYRHVVVEVGAAANQRVVRGGILAVPAFDFSGPGRELYDTHVWDRELDCGVPLESLLAGAEKVPVQIYKPKFARGISVEELLLAFPAKDVNERLTLSHDIHGVRIQSSLEAEKHSYIYARQAIPLDRFSPIDGCISLNAIVGTGVMSSVVVLFIGEDGSRIESRILQVNSNHELQVPPNTSKVHLGLRVQGSGVMEVNGFSFEPVDALIRKTPVHTRGKHLVLTNVYPSNQDLYRNGFVHSRVRSYRDAGLEPVVFCLNPKGDRSNYEFEGVDVIVGDESDLAAAIACNEFSAVLVHFLDEKMWNAVRDAIPNIPVIVWIHGAEVQPWHRRDFNYHNEGERNQAKILSGHRTAFWRRVFSAPHPHLHFVFVSEYFASEVMKDIGVSIPSKFYSVIHNFIDTDIFDYSEKDDSSRFRLLSIRPFASRKYANDLTVEAILALREHAMFDSAEFRIIGDGPLFDSVLEPLMGLKNVTIERGFLTQASIAELHKKFGIFLTPTRMDSQGVSRDEAMSSGLVPVTNAVTAIPEFVDEETGILAPGGDSIAMAQGIARLWENPAMFRKMSAQAAQRVRQQTAFEQTIGAEIGLISRLDGSQTQGASVLGK